MSTAVQISVSEYLSSSYRPDCDYVDGELEERNLGEEYHGLIQKMLAAIIFNNRLVWKLRSITEQRVQVSPTRYRVPDVVVVPSSQPIQGVMRTPPFLCVEVLSPEDRFQRVQERVREYLMMGVPHVWIIDPETREAWTATLEGGVQPLQRDALTLPGTPVHITIAELFEEIDETPKA